MADKTKIKYADLEVGELKKLLLELKEKLRAMRINQVVGSNFDLGEYRRSKKSIAQINTILTLKARKEAK